MCHNLQSYLSYVAKIVDEKQYVPCRNVNEMKSQANLLHLVLRHEQTGFFKRRSYTYTFPGHHLRDILIWSDNGSGGPTSSLLHNDDLFSELPAAAIRQKSSWHMEAGAETPGNGSDSSLKIDQSSSTTVSTTELTIRQLTNLDSFIKEIQNKWCFDDTHRLWENIAEKTNEIFFITGVVFTQTGLDISYQDQAGGVFRTILKEVLKLLLIIKKEDERSTVIPKDAVLAYKLQKLQVDRASGKIKLPVGNMSSSDDNQMKILNTKPEKEIADCRLIYSKYCGKLSSEKQAELRKTMQELLPAATFVELEYSDNSVAPGLSGDGKSGAPRLKRLNRMMMDALRINDCPKEKETTDLLQELGVQRFLDLSTEPDVVYGVSYFVTALLCLNSAALPWLSKCASEEDEHEMSRAVTELERLLHCVDEERVYSINEVAPKVQTFLSLALLEDEESFLYAWRAAYVSAIYLYGLPVASASA